MKRQTVVFIVNPISGKGNGLRLANVLPPKVDTKLFDVSVEVSESRGHAHVLAKNAVEAQIDIVVAVGGDGTVNEIASALVESNTKLCIIPSGSGNGIARHLGIPIHPEKALGTLIDGQHSRIDVMYFGDKFCMGVAGIGFDALVGKKFNESPVRGLASYVRIVLKEIKSYKPIHVRIKSENLTVSEEVLLVCFANGSQYGNNAVIAPRASMCNEEILICIVKKMGAIHLPAFVYALFSRSLRKSKHVTFYAAKKINVQQSGSMAHVDGEPIEVGKNVEISLKNKALSVLHPAGKI